MTTDFTTKVSSFPGGLMPEATDTPLDIRTRVETEADILSIPKPYIGMVVYVKDTGKRFEVLTLKDKKQGLKVAKNALVDTYRELTVDQDLSHLASKADEDAREIYTTDQLTVNPLGGITAKTDLNGLTVKEILTKLLYPYVKPLVSATSAPNGGIYEKGDNKTITNVKAVITKKSESITKVEVFDGATSLGVKEDATVADGGTFNFPVSVPVNSVDKLLTVKATDESGTVVSANTESFIFVYPYYSGVCAEDAIIDENLIKGLNKKIESKGNKTIAYDCDNQKMVFAYPKSYGKLKIINDQNNFDVTATFTINEVLITGLDGTAQEYYVYVNNASTVTNFNMKFNIS